MKTHTEFIEVSHQTGRVEPIEAAIFDDTGLAMHPSVLSTGQLSDCFFTVTHIASGKQINPRWFEHKRQAERFIVYIAEKYDWNKNYETIQSDKAICMAIIDEAVKVAMEGKQPVNPFL